MTWEGAWFCSRNAATIEREFLACACEFRVRAHTSFCRVLSDSVGLCRFPSTAGWGIDDCGLMIADWGLVIGDCKIVSLGCGLDGSSVVFRFRIVRGFCFVKYDAREIPAYAGMT